MKRQTTLDSHLTILEEQVEGVFKNFASYQRSLLNNQ